LFLLERRSWWAPFLFIIGNKEPLLDLEKAPSLRTNGHFWALIAELGNK
jgi:hypothetical protein